MGKYKFGPSVGSLRFKKKIWHGHDKAKPMTKIDVDYGMTDARNKLMDVDGIQISTFMNTDR